jgi:ABC-type glucose/galactose transport system permease subunit
MSITPLVALGTLVFTFVNFLRFLAARNWSAVLTQLIAWAAGIAGVFLLKATDFASGIKIGDLTLDKVGFWSALLVGLLATSLLSTVNEVKKAIDNKDSAQVPALLPNRQGRQP